jgi:tRNA-dihydrouridine synthase B
MDDEAIRFSMFRERPQPKLYLAPLKGFTDAVFRRTYVEHFSGFEGAVAPFITAIPSERLTERHTRDVLPGPNGGMALVPQILGCVSADFICLSNRLHGLGYPEVNWNLGCPFRPVVKKKRGSGLLPFPGLVDEFLDQIVPSLAGRLSIKMRLGRSEPDEIFSLLPVLNRYPIERIIIHPRTGRQMYGGRPDLEAFQACLEASRHRLVYNGDITSLNDFQILAQRFPRVDSWMIGRGALTDPFLPAVIKAGRNDISARVEKFKAFYDDLFQRYQAMLYGPGHLLDRMKGFWKYFAAAFTTGPDIEKRIHRTFKLSRYVETVERFFREEAQWKETGTSITCRFL